MEIKLDNKRIYALIGDDTKKDIFNIDKEVISTNFNFKKETLIEEVEQVLQDINYLNYHKKANDALIIVGLESKKNEKIETLSTGEKILLNIACSLSKNTKEIIFDDIFYYLDNDNRKLLIKLIRMMQLRYGKTILIVSNNIDFIYPFVDYYYVINEHNIVLEGDKELFYDKKEELEKYNVDIPRIVEFINLVFQKKSIILHHRNDTKDLMKDIYRSVI